MRSKKADTNTKARIRDAAIVLIGRNGFAATSARAVAAEAAVSPGLVIHHYGSMRELKSVCDDFIITEVTQRKAGAGSGDVGAAVSEWYADFDTYEPWLTYLGRLFTDDTESGADLFDRFVALSRTILNDGVASGHVNPSPDEHARAVVLVTHSLAMLTLQTHVSRALGTERLSLDALSRMSAATLDIYTHGIYTSGNALRATRDAASTARANQSEKGQGS